MARVERHLRAETLRAPARVHVTVLAALAIALLVAVGFGTGSRSLTGAGDSARLLQPQSYLGDTLLVVLTLGILGLAALVYVLWPERRSGGGEPERVFEAPRPLWAALYLFGVILAAVGALTVTVVLLRRHGTPTPLPAGSGGVRRSPAPTTPAANDLPVFHWWGVVAAVVVLLLVVLAVVRAMTRRAGEVAPPVDETDDVREAIAISLEELEQEPDPRRAVIRTYARMEDVLGRHGLGRRPFETSLEHLRRTLTALHVSGKAAQQLALLFERAKFSPHEVGIGMKREAIVALTTVRDELETR